MLILVILGCFVRDGVRIYDVFWVRVYFVFIDEVYNFRFFGFRVYVVVYVFFLGG